MSLLIRPDLLAALAAEAAQGTWHTPVASRSNCGALARFEWLAIRPDKDPDGRVKKLANGEKRWVVRVTAAGHAMLAATQKAAATEGGEPSRVPSESSAPRRRGSVPTPEVHIRRRSTAKVGITIVETGDTDSESRAEVARGDATRPIDPREGLGARTANPDAARPGTFGLPGTPRAPTKGLER